MNRPFLICSSFAVALAGFASSGRAQFTFTAINYPGATATYADGIGPGGEVVGEYTVGSTTRPFIRTAAGAYSTFTVPGAGAYSTANGMNTSGQVVGLYSPNGSVLRGYLRTGSTYKDM